MHCDHRAFLDGLHHLRKIDLTFWSKEDGHTLMRRCAPMDFGPRRRAHNPAPCYHVWDYESDVAPHTLSLLPEQVIAFKAASETFSPAEFVTWAPIVWFVDRDWGAFSGSRAA
jgi:hypothetical protein